MGLDPVWDGRGRLSGGGGGVLGDRLELGEVRVAGEEEFVVGEHGEGLGAGGAFGERGGVGHCGGCGEDWLGGGLVDSGGYR